MSGTLDKVDNGPPRSSSVSRVFEPSAALIAARHAFYTTRLFHAIINILAMTVARELKSDEAAHRSSSTRITR